MSFRRVLIDTYGILLQVCIFLDSRDTISFSVITHSALQIFDDDLLWKVLFLQHFIDNSTVKNHDKRLPQEILSPKFSRAIGWRVSIDGREGTIVGYRARPSVKYSIQYDDDLESTFWESETRPSTNAFDSSAGVSRFCFLSPPTSEEDIHLSSFGTQRSFWSSPLKRKTWRDEYLHYFQILPQKLVSQCNFADEVLDVSFSPNGHYLVGCCRDGSYTISQVSSEGSLSDPVRYHLGSSGFAATRLCWSPDSFFLTVLGVWQRTGQSRLITLQLDPTTRLWRQVLASDQLWNVCPVWLNNNTLFHFPAERNTYQSHIHTYGCTIFLRSDDSGSPVLVEKHFTLTFDSYDGLWLPAVLSEAHCHSIGPDGSIPSSTNLLGCIRAHVDPALGNMLCILPLNQLLHESSADIALSFRMFPHIDTQGHIVGIRGSHGGRLAVVNVRPLTKYIVHAEHTDLSTNRDTIEVYDIDRMVELRIYDCKLLQHTHTFRGHAAFTLKELPYFIFLDCWSSAGYKGWSTDGERNLFGGFVQI